MKIKEIQANTGAYPETKHYYFEDQNEAIAGQPDIPEPETGEISEFQPEENPMIPTDADVSPLWNKQIRESTKAEIAEEYDNTKYEIKIENGVKKPSHYKFFGEDSMPMLEKILGTEEYIGFLKGNALKYRLRCGKKEGNSISNDIAKAMYYEELYNDFVKANTP